MSGICLKILLCGDSSVGKTTLLLRYVDDKFTETHMTTIGVENKDKLINIKGKEINLQIWDTSGQERFQSITKNFFRNADGIIFVFDITKEDSFEHIKNWLTNSEDCKKDFKKILVGNKLDLEEEREVNKERMEKFAEKSNMKCFEISAKRGVNVELIFREIAELILANKTDEEIKNEFVIRPHSLNLKSNDDNYSFARKKKCC